MRAYIYTIVLLAFFSPTVLSLHAEEIESLVRDEMKATYQSAQADLARAKKKDADLRAMQDRALASAAKQAKMDESGIDLMNNYNMLISSRYITDKGEFQPGAEISEKDQSYINKILKSICTPPHCLEEPGGRGPAYSDVGSRKTAGAEKNHSTPNEVNNSELEIIALQESNNAIVLKKATDRMADISAKLGSKVASDSGSSATDTTVRAPSSSSSNK